MQIALRYIFTKLLIGITTPYKRESWTEKLQDEKEFPKTLDFDSKMPCGPALSKAGAKKGDSVVLVSGLEINGVMKNVPKGKLITLGRLCEIIAEKHKTDCCCTLTSGICITVAANAAEEMGTDVPWWRTLKNRG